ncbi:hypothetical protein PVA45_06055 [Entomospira entomophila]|uniref:Uncharacterized protein n=1 Tax=Entomospira entomophila TaxID=2719988 RepID=A0A968GAR1_9SPIO|nr:hypothetical protein [Entomospira entomophilus]NIZ41062.1 hypothetical protein [Entomospira entomophilus]WDI35271.1 hypothetical protein PVA45_06055 [Entomospira entomophilus]
MALIGLVEIIDAISRVKISKLPLSVLTRELETYEINRRTEDIYWSKKYDCVQDRQPWFYDFGYDWVGFVDHTVDPPRYGAIPRKIAIYRTFDLREGQTGWRNDHYFLTISHGAGGRLFFDWQELIFYEKGFYFSFYSPKNHGDELFEYYFMRIDGQFWQTEDVSLLGEVLHHYDFTNVDSLLSQESIDKLKKYQYPVEFEQPRYVLYADVFGADKLGFIYAIARHPEKEGVYIIEMSGTHYLYGSGFSHTKNPKGQEVNLRDIYFSRTKTYYKLDAINQQLSIMSKTEVDTLGNLDFI